MQSLLLKKFDSPSGLIARFSPGELLKLMKENNIITLEECYTANYPTLRDISLTFGDATSHNLLGAYIVNLNKTCNINRMNPDQIHDATTTLAQVSMELKISEVQIFFQRCKQAKYGSYYGSLDLPKIMEDFWLFMRDRNDAIKEAERKKKKEELNAIWEKIKNHNPCEMPATLKQIIR